MTTVSLREIQRDPLSFLRLVEEGGAFVVVSGDQPVAEVTPVVRQRREPRPCGLCAGEFVVPDDFDAPLPDSVLREFEGPSRQTGKRPDSDAPLGLM